MAVNVFDYNQNKLKAIFDAHATDSLMNFTEVFKFCSSARIFPDLLTSQDLRSLIARCSNFNSSDLSTKLSFSQFISFLKVASYKCFPERTSQDSHKLLMTHMKNSCHIRYGVDLDPNEKKNLRPKLRLNTTGVKTKTGINFKPVSARHSTSSRFQFSNSKVSLINKKVQKLYAMVSPRVNQGNFSRFADSLSNIDFSSPRPPVSERSREPLTSTSKLLSLERDHKVQKIKKLFKKFKDNNQSITAKGTDKRKCLEKILGVAQSYLQKRQLVKNSFQIWNLQVRMMKL